MRDPKINQNSSTKQRYIFRVFDLFVAKNKYERTGILYVCFRVIHIYIISKPNKRDVNYVAADERLIKCDMFKRTWCLCLRLQIIRYQPQNRAIQLLTTQGVSPVTFLFQIIYTLSLSSFHSRI